MNVEKYLEKYEHLFDNPDTDEGMRDFIISMLQDDYWQDFTKDFLEKKHEKGKDGKYE
ncbi:MAG: hypothetical protein ACSLEN_01025 [Candidatus Malihini olakiniferum]